MLNQLLNRWKGALEALVWLCFVGGLMAALFPHQTDQVLSMAPYLTIDGLTRIIWPYASLITGIILRFSNRYMAGNKRIGHFYLRCVLFLLAVMVLSATDHLLLFWGSWCLMGLQMAGLIGHQKEWPPARAAGHFALRYFLAGAALVGAGVLTLYVQTGTMGITESLTAVNHLDAWTVPAVFACLFLAAIIQSALFPFQDWLMSSMTAPTPASALMHAGFVNAGGVLLTRFAWLFANELHFMLLLVGIGALSAFLGKTWKSVQTAVKGQLGCSTVAQMGFMILQCGLGYFTAAITHLILHGFYKGYLFLSSGAAIKQTVPEEKDRSTSPGLLLEAAVTAVLCAGVFMLITGKGKAMNSGLILTAVVVFAVVHGCREFVDRLRRTSWFRYVLFPAISVVSTAVYSWMYVGVTSMMSDVPFANAPTPFHWIHGVMLGVFLGAYLVMVTGVHRSFPRLYVSVLNASQPNPDTIVSYRDEYHV